MLDVQHWPDRKGYHGLAGEMDATTGMVTLFARRSDGELQQVTDTLAPDSLRRYATTLATAGANYGFRGVALAPLLDSEPGTFALLGIGATDGPGSLRLAAAAEGLEREDAGRALRRGRLA